MTDELDVVISNLTARIAKAEADLAYEHKKVIELSRQVDRLRMNAPRSGPKGR